MHIKKEIRILGIDDGPFNKFKDKECLVVGVVMRGGLYLDSVLSTRVTVDGEDSTEKIIEMINKSRQKDQIRVIMIDGISLAGFNVVDIERLFKETKKPVIAVTRKNPNFKEIYNAIRHTKNWERKWGLIKKAGKPKRVLVKDGYVYFQFYGLSEEDAKRIIKVSSVNSRIPEPIRIAHLIAEGIVLGESKGKV